VHLQKSIFECWAAGIYQDISASEAEELVAVLSCVRDSGLYPYPDDLPVYFTEDSAGGFGEILKKMQEYDGLMFNPEGNWRPVRYYYDFLREAEKQGFIFILPLKPIPDGSCEIYHLSLPVDRDIIFGATPGLNGNTDLCDIIISYTNWPGLWEALYGKVSSV
jgi:hypothetical protein